MASKLQQFLTEQAFFGSAVGVQRRLIGKAFLHWCCGRRMYKVAETSRDKITLDKFFNPDYVICDNCGNWYNVLLSRVPM